MDKTMGNNLHATLLRNLDKSMQKKTDGNILKILLTKLV